MYPWLLCGEPCHRRVPRRASGALHKGPKFQHPHHQPQRPDFRGGGGVDPATSEVAPCDADMEPPEWTGSGARRSEAALRPDPSGPAAGFARGRFPRRLGITGHPFPRCRPSNRSCKFRPRGASSSSASSSYRLTARNKPGRHIGLRLPAERWACSRPSLGRAAGPAPLRVFGLRPLVCGLCSFCGVVAFDRIYI